MVLIFKVASANAGSTQYLYCIIVSLSHMNYIQFNSILFYHTSRTTQVAEEFSQIGSRQEGAGCYAWMTERRSERAAGGWNLFASLSIRLSVYLSIDLPTSKNVAADVVSLRF